MAAVRVGEVCVTAVVAVVVLVVEVVVFVAVTLLFPADFEVVDDVVVVAVVWAWNGGEEGLEVEEKVLLVSDLLLLLVSLVVPSDDCDCVVLSDEFDLLAVPRDRFRWLFESEVGVGGGDKGVSTVESGSDDDGEEKTGKGVDNNDPNRDGGNA